MNKIVLILALLVSAIYVNAKTQKVQLRMSDDCRRQAYDAANASGYEYGSEDWQWVYYSEKKMCEME